MATDPVISATALMAVQCCLESPLVGLFSLIRVRWTSLPVRVDMATEVHHLAAAFAFRTIYFQQDTALL